MQIECTNYDRCASKNTTKCKWCKFNKLRNKQVDYFVEAKDNPIPEKCPKISYDGPAEQTKGYKCPVCGEFSNPYHIGKDKLCLWCGYELNI